MQDLSALAHWVKTEKGITKITLEDLVHLIPEFELWKQNNKLKPMQDLKQRILEHIADLLDEPTFELDMRLRDCIDPLPSDKSKLHLLMTDAAFKVFCNYFGKQDNTEQCNESDIPKQKEVK